MSIRLPLTGVFDTTHTDVSGSVSGGWAYPFKIPQDTDNVVLKVLPSIVAGGISVIFQTSDDGGTTYHDVSRTSIASQNEVGKAPQWVSIPVISGLPRSVPVGSLIAAGSLIAGVFNGSASASTLASGQNSGLPIMGIQNRVFVITTGNASSTSTRIQVLVNSQSSAGQ